jgi:hypothetical protein
VTTKKRPAVTIDEREDLERIVRVSEERRRRVVAALLALRDVKSIGMDPEPVVRTMRVQLWTLPQLADDLELEDAETIRQILELQIAQIFDEIEQTLHALYEQPRSPALARYIAADRELRQLDLADE